MALFCSRVFRSYLVKDFSPAALQRSPVLWVRQYMEMGSFHSSMPRLMLVSQEQACQLYWSRACHAGTGSMSCFTAAHHSNSRTIGCPSWCPPPCKQLRPCPTSLYEWCSGKLPVEGTALLGAMFWWGQPNRVSGVCVQESMGRCPYLSHQLTLPSHVGTHRARDAALWLFWHPVQQPEEPPQWYPFWAKLWFCMSQMMEHALRNIPIQHSKILLFVLSDPYWCHIFNFVDLFCPALRNFRQI